MENNEYYSVKEAVEYSLEEVWALYSPDGKLYGVYFRLDAEELARDYCFMLNMARRFRLSKEKAQEKQPMIGNPFQNVK